MDDIQNTCGRLTSCDAGDLQSPVATLCAPSETRLCVWRPDFALEGFRGDTALPLLCYTSAAGRRSFRPVGDRDQPCIAFKRFYSDAWVCGFAIRCRLEPDLFDAKLRFSYRAMWFFFQKAHHMKPFIQRRFNSMMDLQIRDAGDQRRKVPLFPWPTDASAQKLGFPKTIPELRQVGRQAALSEGVENPNHAQIIHYGLAAAAKLAANPLSPLSPEHTRRRIEFALFDIDDRLEPLSPEVEERVAERILETMEPHFMSEEPWEDVQKWFWGGNNSFVKQVAKGLGEWTLSEAQDLVTHVLLKLGFKSYEYVGQSIHAVAQQFQRSLETPLTDEEWVDFAGLYYPHDHFGGLPLVLLAEKLEFLEGVLSGLLLKPDDAATLGAFHQLLFFYGDIVRRRREADRAAKASTAQPSGPIAFDDQRDSPAPPPKKLSPDDVRPGKLYEKLAKEQNLACPCGSRKWLAEVKEQKPKTATLEFSCQACGQKAAPILVSMTELQRLGRDL